MKKKADIARQWQKHLKISRRGLSRQYDNTRECNSFYDGDSMQYNDRIQYMTTDGRKQRALVQFNKVQAPIDAVQGFFAQNRRKAKYIARIKQSEVQEQYTKYCNAGADYIRENANADQVESEQDKDMLVCGYGAVETDISYITGTSTTDPNGEIVIAKLDPLTCGWDPYSKTKNTKDKRWVYYWQDYDIEDALSLFEDSTDDDFELANQPDNAGQYYYNPYGGKYDKIRFDTIVEWSDVREKMVRVYNYQWFDYDSFFRADNPIYSLKNPEAVQLAAMQLDMIARELKEKNAEQDYDFGDMFDFDPRAKVLTFDNATKTRLVKAFGKYIEPVEFKRKCYYTAILSGKHVFKVFKSICQQDFSIKMKTGTYAQSLMMYIGMVNPMMEPTRYGNKALTELMFTIAANSKGGVMVEEDAVEDVADFENKWAKTDATLVVRPGALTGGKIQEKGRPALPTGLDSIINLCDAAVVQNGVDPAFVGGNDNPNESGLLFRRRIRMIISKLGKYADATTMYQKDHARMLLDYMRIWAQNNNGAMFRLTGEGEEDTFEIISADKFMAEYDVVIQETKQDPEEKEETAELLSSIGDKYLSVQALPQASAIYAVALKYLNLDRADIMQVTQAIAPQGQEVDPAAFQALQEENAQLKAQITQAEVKKSESQAILNMAKAENTKVDTQKKGAETVRTLEESQQIDVETNMIKRHGSKEIRANV